MADKLDRIKRTAVEHVENFRWQQTFAVPPTGKSAWSIRTDNRAFRGTRACGRKTCVRARLRVHTHPLTPHLSAVSEGFCFFKCSKRRSLFIKPCLRLGLAVTQCIKVPSGFPGGVVTHDVWSCGSLHFMSFWRRPPTNPERPKWASATWEIDSMKSNSEDPVMRATRADHQAMGQRRVLRGSVDPGAAAQLKI